MLGLHLLIFIFSLTRVMDFQSYHWHSKVVCDFSIMHPILAYGAVALYSRSLAMLLFCEIFSLLTCFLVLLSIKDKRKEKSLDDTGNKKAGQFGPVVNVKKRLETKSVNLSPYWIPPELRTKNGNNNWAKKLPYPKALCQVFFLCSWINFIFTRNVSSHRHLSTAPQLTLLN